MSTIGIIGIGGCFFELFVTAYMGVFVVWLGVLAYFFSWRVGVASLGASSGNVDVGSLR